VTAPASGAPHHPLSVLMICPQFRPLVGGYERAAERMSLALAERGHRVGVVSERRDRRWPAREDGAVPLRRLPCIHRAGLHLPTALASLGGYLLRHGRRYRIHHVHQPGPHAGLAVLLRRVTGARTVMKLTTADAGAIRAAAFTGGPAARILAPWTRSVDACLVPTPSTREAARAAGFPDHRIHVVPNGVDVTAFRPASGPERVELRRRLGLEGPAVLLVGRLAAEKNPLGLLRAWRDVHRARPDAVLLLVGDGPQRGEVALAAAAPELGGSVRVQGAVDDPRPWLGAADLFVLPSRREGLSNALLEALACGLPVVSTAVSGSMELFAAAEIGRMVPTGDEDALAGALLGLIGDAGERARCSAAARAVVETGFATELVAERLERLYGSLLADGGPGG
jgi:glycosyltransferase involved in cell wall biosynthesis